MQEKGNFFSNPKPGPETETLKAETLKHIQQALLALSEKDRSILLLYSQEELPYKQIAIVLEISVSAVKVRLHRARQRFGKAFQEVQE